jgi:hypothetical protein
LELEGEHLKLEILSRGLVALRRVSFHLATIPPLVAALAGETTKRAPACLSTAKLNRNF